MLRINGRQRMIKDIRGDIKYGATAEELARFFDVSEKVFMENLEKRLGQNFSDYKRDLAKNASRRKRELARQRDDRGHDEVKEPSAEVKVAKTQEEELEGHVAALSNKIQTLKAESGNIQQKIAEKDAAIEEIKDALARLAEEIKQHQGNLLVLNAERSEAISSKALIDLEVKAQEELLAKAEEELEACREVKISCGSDGIEISRDGFEPTMQDVEAKYIELSRDGKFDNYAVKHVRAAAQILCAVEFLEVMEVKYSVDYEEALAPVKEIFNAVVTAA